VRTTVTIPDGGTLMLGGMKMAQKQTFESGVPFLKDIPLVSFLFSRKGTYIANKKILILLHASIVIPEEHEPVLRQPDDLSITRR
jgi:general secretion pathway protein D